MEKLEMFQRGLELTILCLEELAPVLRKTPGVGLPAILEGDFA